MVLESTQPPTKMSTTNPGMENLYFKTFCRMSPSDFEALINLVGPKIAKADSTFQKAIPVAERLALTLR
jgi:hypothetical protein